MNDEPVHPVTHAEPARPASEIPCVDVHPLIDGGPIDDVAVAIDAACRRDGFFTVVGHGIDPTLHERLDRAARAFFSLPATEKAAVAMAKGGRTWRGWFPEDGELTAGMPDAKEGFYFGADLPADDPRVVAGRLLHGPNLWPVRPFELRPAVETWMTEMRALANGLVAAMAVGLGLPGDWFARHLTAEPTELFRIFRYPSVVDADRRWGVAEHTDYGLLTILAQDHNGGLQVHGRDGWIDVPPVPGTLVCNIGDMLDRMTGGRYRSTPHRVQASAAAERLSFPYFFDPGWEAEVRPIPLEGTEPADDAAQRWDGTSLRTLTGTYGDYLSTKVARVFPALAES